MGTIKSYRLAAGAVIGLLICLWLVGDPSYLLKKSQFDGKKEGYVVSFIADSMYAIENFAFHLKFSDFHVERGILIPGTTEVGTTVLLLLGDGEWTVRTPDRYRWTNVVRDSSTTPFSEGFSSLFLRIHPDFYQPILADARLEKIRDKHAFEQAEVIYKHKFWNSFHINERALIPSEDIGIIDIESVTWGRLQIHEGRGIGQLHFMPPEVTHWDYEGNPPPYMD